MPTAKKVTNKVIKEDKQKDMLMKSMEEMHGFVEAETKAEKKKEKEN